MFRTLLCLMAFCLPVVFVGCGDSGNKVVDVSEIPPEWADDPSYDDLE